jgi:hypothetical protein
VRERLQRCDRVIEVVDGRIVAAASARIDA